MFSIHQRKLTYTISFLVALLTIHGCQAITLYLRQGQDAQLNFSYPCDSSEVTLQHGYKAPFYRLTEGSSLTLPQDQANRFKVQNRTNNGNCSLKLTIRNLMRGDAGTYFSTIYKNGILIDKLTTRVGLQIDYPPGKATCVREEDKGRNWEAIECTADVGSISGKIECYQNGEQMPSLTDPVETSIILTEIILIRKSEPAFCCSSTFDEYKSQCECNDTFLNLPDEGSRSRDPCPKTSLTTMPYVYNVTENAPTNHLSTMISHTSMKTKQDIPKSVIIHLILAIVVVILLIMSLLIHYKMKTKTRKNHNDNDPPQSSESLLDIDEGEMRNGAIKKWNCNTIQHVWQCFSIIPFRRWIKKE